MINNLKDLKSRIKDIEGNIKNLNFITVKIIDLDHKAFIFLDTPNGALFNNLMSVLNQDFKEQQYLFTEKDSSEKGYRQKRLFLKVPL